MSGFRNRLYYGLKPLVPASARHIVRKWYVRRQRKHVGEVWPILPGSERPPEGWPGWPEGKKFAFVLTHDVEGQTGVEKCRQLMEMEMRCGFRSSFNFIPEGEYRVDRELRECLSRNGFETGIHDLHHDGRLYQNRHHFAQKAVQINQHLKHWGAVGFRSGFMLHNLEWLHDLDIQYDASTFDTDPFEPQPDNLGTIFPFWVPGMADKGYLELPYTLPQDSTLFLLLGETSPKVWFQKLDWIAQNGGMALINVHPDYLCFGGEPVTSRTYPVAFYESFLQHVARRYAGAYWHVLPKDLAAWHRNGYAPVTEGTGQSCAFVDRCFVSALPAKQPFKPMRAVVLLYGDYASDARPREEAEALARRGMEVDVISLGEDGGSNFRERICGVNVFQIPMRRRRSSKFVYIFQYAWFAAASCLLLSILTLRRRYRLVHVHNMPDFLVFSALLPRLRGAKVILDLHDPMPELFRGIYGFSEDHWLPRWLKKIERRSIAFADLVLTPNKAFRDLFVSRSCPPEKIHIVMNSPSQTLFNPETCVFRPQMSQDKSFTLMYHGLLAERHGLDLAVQAMARVVRRVPDIKLHVYGKPNDYMDGVMKLVRDLGLQDVVQYRGFKSLREIAQALTTIDLGLVPNRLNSFTQINLPTRIFECLAMNKPVLVPRTKGIADYFTDEDILFFEPGNVDDLARKIEWIYQHPAETQSILERGRKVYEQHAWDLEQHRFTGLVDKLTGRGPVEMPVPAAGRPAPVAAASTERMLQGKRAIVMVFSYYPADARPRREAESLVQCGMEVDLVCLREKDSEAVHEKVNGVNVRRVRMVRRREGRLTYLMQYSMFTGWCALIAARRCLGRHYDLVHVHNMPDCLVFSGLIPKLLGATVVLDLHDPMPELMMTIFKLPAQNWLVRLLRFQEKVSLRFADAVLTVNLACARIFAERSCGREKIHVIMNSPDEKIFGFEPIRDSPRWTPAKPFVLMYHGSIVERHGLDLGVRALGMARKKIPNAELRIFGHPNSFWEGISQWPESEREGVRFLGPKTLEQIIQEIEQCDVGIIPNRKSIFTEINTPVRIFEYLSRGKPVIAPEAMGIADYFGPEDLIFFRLGDVADLADKIIYTYFHPDEVKRIVQRGQQIYLDHKWARQNGRYTSLMAGLLCGESATDALRSGGAVATGES